MAVAHEQWVVELFGGLSLDEKSRTHQTPRQTQATSARQSERLIGIETSGQGDIHDTIHTPTPCWPATASTLAGYEARHFGWSVADTVATITLNRPERKNPLTFESYAELRDLFRQLDLCDRRQGRRHSRRGRQFLLGRRRARHHRAADRSADAGTAAVHAHDRRSRESDAPLPATGDRGRRRRLRRRRRDPRDGVRHAARHRAQQARVSCSRASVSPAAIWALARCCRASSARGAPPNCSSPDARQAATKAMHGASTTGCANPQRSSKKRTSSPPISSPVRLSRTASRRRCCIRNGA